ncbi:hypothetical protein HNS03_08355 [Amorphus sp. 3PC139-8]
MSPIETLSPRSRASWIKVGEADVTASVVGALLGCHEYTTPYKLWALKSGLIVEDPEETEAMKRGRLLEPVAVELLRQRHPEWDITHNTNPGTYYRDPAARLGATPDVITHDPARGPGLVQIKNVEQSVFRRKWLGGCRRTGTAALDRPSGDGRSAPYRRGLGDRYAVRYRPWDRASGNRRTFHARRLRSPQARSPRLLGND